MADRAIYYIMVWSEDDLSVVCSFHCDNYITSFENTWNLITARKYCSRNDIFFILSERYNSKYLSFRQTKIIHFLIHGNYTRFVTEYVKVCNLAWSKHSSELVSTHGYSQNQILVWKYPSLVQVAKLTGHSSRVLYLAISPDGEAIVTGAGDETLRFWNVFSKARSQKVGLIL